MSTAMELQRRDTLADGLKVKLREVFEELLARNIHAVAEELLTAEDSTGGVGVRFGMALIGSKVTVDGRISWSRKFQDKEEGVFGFEDPENPALPGMGNEDGEKVIIKTEEGEVTTTLGAMRRAGRVLRKK